MIALPGFMWQRRPREVEVSVHVGSEGLVEFFRRDVRDVVFPLLVCGVRYEDIEPAHLRNRFFHRVVARGGACQIARQAQTAPPFRFDGTLGFLSVAFR